MKKMLSAAGYAILKGVLHLVALLPFGILYGVADIIFVLIFYVVRYRRKLVDRNLATCFPAKSDKERARIARQFYRNFADYIVETIKLLHISDKAMARRFTFTNTEILDRLIAEKRSTVAYFSHCFNWEWAPSVSLHLHTYNNKEGGVELAQIYRPLRNKRFDKLMLQVRSRFGSLSIPKATALRTFVQWRREGIVSVTGFMSDQKPSHGDTVHVVQFLNRPTAVITGTETLARRMSMAAVYWDMHKVRRGHYRIDIRLMSENAADTAEFELTDSYFAMLQQTIERNPAIWLWTHNRWKHPIPNQQ